MVCCMNSRIALEVEAKGRRGCDLFVEEAVGVLSDEAVCRQLGDSEVQLQRSLGRNSRIVSAQFQRLHLTEERQA